MKTKKELKDEYKLQETPKGVYQIKNLENGKIYIGSNINLKAIWNRERAQLNFGSHPNKELQDDWKKFGEQSFEYTILEEIDEIDGKQIDIP